MSFYHNPKIITDGLVLYCDNFSYKSYRSGSDLIYDLTGNYNGSISGNPQITGSFFNFDGVDDQIDFTNIYNHQSSSTIECWFNIDTNQSQSAAIIGYLLNSPGNYSDIAVGGLYVSGTLPTPLTESVGIKYTLITDSQSYRYVRTVVTKNEWHHVALGKDLVSGIMSLWIDGDLKGTQTFDTETYAQWPDPGTYIGSNNNFAIGYTNCVNIGISSPNTNFKGMLSTFKMYNRVLSENEIKDNYLALKRRFRK